MKNIFSIFFLCVVLCMLGCEKPILENTDTMPPSTEQGDNNNKGDASKDSTNTGGTSSTGGNDTDSTTYKDNHEEGDIIDGNGSSGNNGSGTGGTQGGGSSSATAPSSGVFIGGEQAYTVEQFMTLDLAYSIWVVGYIVGDCTQRIDYAEFQPPFTHPQALLLADDPNETNPQKVIAIELKSKNLRAKYNLCDHPENLRHRAAFYGLRGTYLRILGMKDVRSDVLDPK